MAGEELQELARVDERQELVLQVEVVGEGGEVDVEDGGRGAQHRRHLAHRLQEGLRECVAHRRSEHKKRRVSLK